MEQLPSTAGLSAGVLHLKQRTRDSKNTPKAEGQAEGQAGTARPMLPGHVCIIIVRRRWVRRKDAEIGLAAAKQAATGKERHVVHPNRVLHPCIVHSVRGQHVTCVAAAHHHTLFLTQEGQVLFFLCCSFPSAVTACWSLVLVLVLGWLVSIRLCVSEQRHWGGSAGMALDDACHVCSWVLQRPACQVVWWVPMEHQGPLGLGTSTSVDWCFHPTEKVDHKSNQLKENY